MTLARSVAGPAVSDEHALVRGLWRAVDVFRWLALAYAASSLWSRHDEVKDVPLAVGILAVLGGWTIAQTIRPLRTERAYAAELALGCGAILATRLVDHDAVIVAGAKTIPSIWPSAAIVGWAILRGWRGGVVAATLVAAASFVEIIHPTGNTVTNSVFGLLLGGCLGYCVDLARASHDALAQSMRLDAARAERDRLARTVHDGVLQTLAYIHRRGQDLGGDAATLGAMAGEQERILRSLVGQRDLDEVHRVVTGEVDLRQLLAHVERDAVHLVVPGEPVLLARRVGDELVAAVEAALDNVRKHAGEGAEAWVLVDDDGGDVTLTIRDSGRGLESDRLVAAQAEGRLGVASSIKGRLEDLGGGATIRNGPTGGTTVELHIPSRRAR